MQQKYYLLTLFTAQATQFAFVAHPSLKLNRRRWNEL